ncbi:MAG: DEAD/DEAH box helicase [Salinibacterium sp.]|nr:DEAD/DEAH box helicase [Salinibacterium sp.]MBF0671758.1 DEAD/DEAH box helicase [Salinibacterium sp.]
MPSPTPPDDAWRGRLEALVGGQAQASDGRAMALQFELRELIPPAVRRWGGAVARTVTADAAIIGEVRLAVRPVARSTAGNWTRAELSWANLPFKASAANLDEAHHAWFSQFGALHRPVRDVYTGRDGDWLHLDDYQSPLLWNLLADAAGLGIAFVGSTGGSRGAEVLLGREARVALDASSNTEGLTLAPRVEFDGAVANAASVGVIADHGLYRFELTPPRFELAPLDRPLTPERRALLQQDAIVVPAASVDQVVAEFVPELQRRVGVTSTDATVTVPAPAPPPAAERDEEHPDAPRLIIKTVPTDQPDWFDLGIIVRVDEYDIPFGPLFKALAKGQKKFKLVDGTHLKLTLPVFDRLRELIAEAQDIEEWEVEPRISRYQASLWADFEDLADETEEAVEWRAAARGLLDAAEIPRAEHGLDVTLRPYQQEGLDWLAFLHSHGLGGVLADDMGLGKTLQTLALIDHVRRTSADAAGAGLDAVTDADLDAATAPGVGTPFLVVAPTSVVSNWVAEAERWAPMLRVQQVGTTGAELDPSADIVVTSYALFRLDFANYRAATWAGLVLDEAQFVKNHAALVHRCARDLVAPFKLAITGTPMENNLMELRALFAIVAPGLFPSARRFAEEYVRPIESGQRERLERLRRRIRPLMLRRTKALVAADLPEKQEQVVTVELQPEHRHLYDTVLQRERQKLFGLIDDVDRNRMIIFRSLTLLRMLALDATLIDEAHAGVPSSKLEVLLEQLEEAAAEGHRTLVFSQFTSYLQVVAAGLDAAGIRYSYLDGSTRRRREVIDGFTEGEASVFLISLKAGGFGLTLTEADYVFLLDPWWNPAAENQAIDRAHRIGQQRNVMVYRMIAADTIEEKVLALSRRKAELFSSVMDADGVFSEKLTAEDIRWLVE